MHRTPDSRSLTASPVASQASENRRAPRGRLLGLLGPGFVAAIAYVDPGNVAANLSAGVEYGYLLIWVLVLANAMAVLVQYLSAKLGLITGRTLPELLGEKLPRKLRLPYWLQAEITVAATDIAEVIGGAIALQILFGLPLPLGGLIVGVISMIMLSVQSRRGARSFEFVIITMMIIIAIGFLAGLFFVPIDWGQAAGGLVPRFAGTESVLLTASMVGATVMPHAVYLHSSLVRDRHGVIDSPSGARRLLKATRWDVCCALVIAGGVNISMLLLAAASLRGVPGTETLPGAVNAISAHIGPVVGVIFGVGLLASGLASTAVGNYAGSTIMAGMLKRQIPLLLRRALTLIPALIILAVGVDATRALVLSQVILSIGIPFALIPLIWFTSQPQLMGRFANRPLIRYIGVVVATAIVALNVFLLFLTFTS